ncbi:MAG: hypothetical protein KJ579_06275 [Verrucomicrobia bacterium]|nr:hypothetical protein [Verrucomicrobiota bacterium]
MKRAIQVLSFLLLVWMYACTRPVNHTEADVAFRNAFIVEHGAGSLCLRADEVLYLLAMRAMHQAAGFMGLSWSAFGMMSAFSVLCAAATVHLFFHFCYRRFSLRPLSSLLAAALFAVSYGFWRYASEAAAIVPATLAAMGTLYVATTSRLTAPRFVLATAMAALAMLFSVLHVGAMLIVIPLYLVMRRRPWIAAAFVAGSLGWLSLGLMALHAIHGDFLTSYPSLFRYGENLSTGTFLKAIIGLGQSWLSGNFLLGWPAFRDWLCNMFPYRMLAEECYLGRQLPRRLVWGAAITFALAIVCAGIAIRRSIQARQQGAVPRKAGDALPGGRSTLWAVWTWAMVSTAGVLWFQPENAEVWAFGLAPVWLAFCGLVIVPLAQARTLWPVLAMALTMGLHNYIGGMSPLRLPSADLYSAQGTWMLSRARAQDAVLVRDETEFAFWMRARFAGRVEVAGSWIDPHAGFRELTSRVERIWAIGTVFDPTSRPGSPARPPGGAGAGTDAALRQMARDFELVHKDDAVEVYVWPAPSRESGKGIRLPVGGTSR